MGELSPRLVNVDVLKEDNMTNPIPGFCSRSNREELVAADVDFTPEDIEAINDAYFKGKGGFRIHMSEVDGQICCSLPNVIYNRWFADRLAETCKDVLKGKGAKEKCDALYEVADSFAKEPDFWTLEGSIRYVKERLAWLIGAIVLGVIGGWGFHVGWDIRARGKARRAAKKNNKKGPPDNTPPSATGGVAEAKKNPAAQVKAGFGFGQFMQKVDQPQIAPAAKPVPVDVVKIFQGTFLGRYINFAEMAQELSSPQLATLNALRGELPSPTQMDYADMPDPLKKYELVFDSSASEYMNPDRVPIIGVCFTTGLPVGVLEPVVVPPPVWEPVPVRLPVGLRVP